MQLQALQTLNMLNTLLRIHKCTEHYKYTEHVIVRGVHNFQTVWRAFQQKQSYFLTSLFLVCIAHNRNCF